MKHQRAKRYSIVILAIILSISLVMPVFADTSLTKTNATNQDSLGIINITGKSYIELKQAMIIPSSDGKTVTFTFSIYNGGSTDLSFVDYWVRMRSKAGARFTANLISEDQEKNKVSPMNSQEYTFYATVNDSVELQDLVFEFIKWDFSMPNYERKLGEIRIPSNYSEVVPTGSHKYLSVQNSVIKTSINRMVINDDVENHNTSVYLNFENTGLRSVNVPEYSYYIRSSEGLMYTLDLDKEEKLSIQPRVNKEIKLKAKIPVGVETDNWQLLMTRSSNDIEIPIGLYQLPKSSLGSESITDGVIIGTQSEIIHDDKKYGITLKSMQQIPWEDQDIVSAQITLSNLDNIAIPLLPLQGYFILDGVKMNVEDTVTVRSDNILGLAKGSETNLTMYLKIPYTYQYDDIDLVILEEGNIDPDDEEKLVVFSHKSESLVLPHIAVGDSTQITNIGKRAEISIREINTYKDSSTNVFYVEVEMENLEKRQTELAKLTGYLKTEDDTYFPVNISELKEKISPSGKALMSFWTKLPKKYSTKKMELVIGEEINKDDKAIIEAVTFELPLEKVLTPRQGFESVKIFPYEIELTHMKVSLSSNATLDFNYTASRVNEYETVHDGHKLVIELVDGDIAYAQEYEFETDIKLGAHKGQMTANMNIDNVLNKMQSIDGFEIKVYDQFEGHKKLLASQRIYNITSGF